MLIHWCLFLYERILYLEVWIIVKMLSTTIALTHGIWKLICVHVRLDITVTFGMMLL